MKRDKYLEALKAFVDAYAKDTWDLERMTFALNDAKLYCDMKLYNERTKKFMLLKGGK